MDYEKIIGVRKSTCKNNLINMLSILFTNKIEVEEKKQRLSEEYNMEMRMKQSIQLDLERQYMSTASQAVDTYNLADTFELECSVKFIYKS